jgi:hypothetical protein
VGADEIRWLAETTGLDVSDVEAGFAEGDLRRKVVVDELLEAGLAGPELLDLVMRLTGLPRDDAIALIAGERATGEHEPEAQPPAT